MNYTQQEVMAQIERQNAEKYKNLVERVSEFENISTLEEAKELAKKILPTSQEMSRFTVGKSNCVVINTKEHFRISIDSPEEFISYDFS